MSDPRLILKYPNRRLYDKHESRYVCLCDLQQLVSSGIDILVMEKKTDRDITPHVLLQMINMQPHPSLTSELLHRVLRANPAKRIDLVAISVDLSGTANDRTD